MVCSVHRLVSILLLLVLWGAAVDATVQNYTAEFDANVQRLLNKLNNETVIIDTIPTLNINVPDVIVLDIDLADVSITGYADIKGTQCTYDPDNNGTVTMSLFEPSLEIYAAQLSMKGTLFGNIVIDGSGDGWFWLENFKMSIEGPTKKFDFNGSRPIIEFDEVVLTLDLEQWTVDMRGLTPGSDLNQMMNSVLTMAGPEIFHALGDSITNSPWFKLLVNRIFRDPGTTPEPGESTTEGQTGTTEETSETPTDVSTNAPTTAPTATPTDTPATTPTDAPTTTPTDAPTTTPTDAPTTTPTDAPTTTPTDAPTTTPTDAPTTTPTDTSEAILSNNVDADLFHQKINEEHKQVRHPRRMISLRRQ